MLYRVRATLIPERMAEFWTRLTDGSIDRQKPDGKEIIASMQRARIVSPDTVEWTETCYCPTPLQHERETVYDRFFSSIETEEITAGREIEGESFWEYLRRLPSSQ